MTLFNSCWLKKQSQPGTWELDVFFGNYEDFRPGRQHLKWPREIASRRWGKELGYMEVCNKEGWRQAVCQLRKTRYLRSLVLFFVWEDASTWAHGIHSFHMHLSSLGPNPAWTIMLTFLIPAAAAAAKSLQSCPTLCDPLDGSPPGSAVPGILQARIQEWASISFSSAWKWKVKLKSLSRVWLFTTPWTVTYQAPPSMGFSRQEYWSGVPFLAYA